MMIFIREIERKFARMKWQYKRSAHKEATHAIAVLVALMLILVLFLAKEKLKEIKPEGAFSLSSSVKEKIVAVQARAILEDVSND